MIEYQVTKVEPFKDPEIEGDGFVLANKQAMEEIGRWI